MINRHHTFVPNTGQKVGKSYKLSFSLLETKVPFMHTHFCDNLVEAEIENKWVLIIEAHKPAL